MSRILLISNTHFDGRGHVTRQEWSGSSKFKLQTHKTAAVQFCGVPDRHLSRSLSAFCRLLSLYLSLGTSVARLHFCFPSCCMIWLWVSLGSHTALRYQGQETGPDVL